MIIITAMQRSKERKTRKSYTRAELKELKQIKKWIKIASKDGKKSILWSILNESIILEELKEMGYSVEHTSYNCDMIKWK